MEKGISFGYSSLPSPLLWIFWVQQTTLLPRSNLARISKQLKRWIQRGELHFAGPMANLGPSSTESFFFFFCLQKWRKVDFCQGYGRPATPGSCNARLVNCRCFSSWCKRALERNLGRTSSRLLLAASGPRGETREKKVRALISHFNALLVLFPRPILTNHNLTLSVSSLDSCSMPTC